MKFNISLLFLLTLTISSCVQNDTDSDKMQGIAEIITVDSHSYSNHHEISTKHLHLELDVNFENRTIYGVARHEMNTHNAENAIFDIKELKIIKVTIGKGNEVATDYVIGKHDELLGSSLSVKIQNDTKYINIYYQTTDKAEALDWLSPEQTSGKAHPFLYTQGQAILTRTWIPLQDTPMNRITYSADVTVPKGLMAVMSASNPTEKNLSGKYSFTMEQKIPSYLIALAVGNLTYTKLGSICGVYSEPELTGDCAYEFSDLPKMITTAEKIYGKYQWGKYDIVMLPYSFPFGGMENPRLTFANPTLLAGDKSLVSVVAHELAHSWSGNLVTNATWNDFWLNEGFTVYFENRIMEKIEGKENANILALIEYQDLIAALDDIENSEHPEDTELKLQLDHRNPDDGMTDIAYVKGAFFLRTIEKAVGRKKLDQFLNRYFTEHAFESITTEVFVADLKNNLLTPNNIDFDVEEWIYQPGLPENHVRIESKKLDEMTKLAERINSGEDVFVGKMKKLTRADFITQEWQTFVRGLNGNVSPETMKKLDDQFEFSANSNPGIKSDWYKLAVRNGYDGAKPEMEKYLVKIGRRWYIEGIYEELMNSKNPANKAFAKAVFEKAKNGYHAVTRNTIESVVARK